VSGLTRKSSAACPILRCVFKARLLPTETGSCRVQAQQALKSDSVRTDHHQAPTAVLRATLHHRTIAIAGLQAELPTIGLQPMSYRAFARYVGGGVENQDGN
jgi:hypothetical protein